MSDTPETDATLIEGGAPYLEIVSAAFARSLERRLQEAEKDAQRYRWLRDGGSPGAYTAWQDDGGSWDGQPIHGDRLDAAIDAALSHPPAEKEKP